jgi:hypothetical protein
MSNGGIVALLVVRAAPEAAAGFERTRRAEQTPPRVSSPSAIGRDRIERLSLKGKTAVGPPAAPEPSSAAVEPAPTSMEAVVVPEFDVVSMGRERSERLPQK